MIHALLCSDGSWFFAWPQTPARTSVRLAFRGMVRGGRSALRASGPEPAENHRTKDHSCFTSDQRFAHAPALHRAGAERAKGPQARTRAAPHGAKSQADGCPRRRLRLLVDQACCASLSFAGPVAGAKSIKPDPISNSAVKLFSADGTVSQDPGE